MKRIDILLIRSFLPPLITWSLVAMFVFNMQFLWKYIDEIVGKGLDFIIILELLLYQALAMVPKALLFGVVIASVMALGNLAEHYELVSMKSAGISLLRILQPLAFVALLLALGSFLFSNYIIPVAALKFKSRLHDIRKQKPALNLAAGKFNNDFRNVVIYIGDKENNRLKDVKIYDHSNGLGLINQTNAREGQLSYSEDRRYLILRLRNGERQEDAKPDPLRPNSMPYMRMSFGEFSTLYDMSEFNFGRTNEQVFARHHSLLAIDQLRNGIDSLETQKSRAVEDFRRSSDNSLYYRRIAYQVQQGKELPEEFMRQRDSLIALGADGVRALGEFYEQLAPEYKEGLGKRVEISQQYFWPRGYVQELPKPTAALIDSANLGHLASRAVGMLRNFKEQAANAQRSIERYAEKQIEHENEIHQKYLHALACLLFLFIGGPMGAIIRKGGFGWPILVSFVFFMIFFIFGLIGEHLATSATWPCWMGSWLPLFVLLPVALVLSYEAINDRRIISIERIKQWMSKRKTKPVQSS